MTGFDIGLAIAVASAVASALGWYRSTTRNQYAREREYSHILRNLEQHSQAFSQLFKLSDALEDRLSRLEILLLRRGDKE